MVWVALGFFPPSLVSFFWFASVFVSGVLVFGYLEWGKAKSPLPFSHFSFYNEEESRVLCVTCFVWKVLRKEGVSSAFWKVF